jgi:tight adherence protein B
MSEGLIIGAAILSLIFVLGGVMMLFADMRSPDAVVGRRLRATSGPTRQQRAAIQLLRDQRSEGVLGNMTAKMPSVKEAIRESGMGLNISHLLMVMAAITLAGFIMFFYGVGMSLSMSLAGSILLGLGGPWYTLKFMAKRRVRRFLVQLPSALDLMVRSLEAGHPVLVAMGLVADEMDDPIRTEFAILVNEISYGLSNDIAFQHLLERVPASEVRFLVAALEIQRQSGGNLGEVLGNLADVLRERFNLQKKIKSLTAEGRISGIIIGIIPFAIGGIIMLINPEYYTGAMDHPMFNVAMGIGLLMLFLGAIAINRMIQVKV